jgi:hypothetical protein
MMSEVDTEDTIELIYNTDNIETLYSNFNGEIKEIYITLKIYIENEYHEPRFRDILFRKATEFFRNNNPHKISYVSLISPENLNIGMNSYDFWNRYYQDKIFTSYSIEIKLIVYQNLMVDYKFIPIDNRKEIMDKIVEECDQNKLKYITEKEKKTTKLEASIIFDYIQNYL